jgi:hypothetical protein
MDYLLIKGHLHFVKVAIYATNHLPFVDWFYQPQVAICVLHRTDYRHAIRDLREYIHEVNVLCPSKNYY